MKCYAEQQNLTESTEGNSGLRPFCIATSVGFFIGDKMLESITCLICGKVFKAHVSLVRKYCSKNCFAKAKSNKIITKDCPICQEEYRTSIKTQVYCSRKCVAVSMVEKRKKLGKYKQRARQRNRVTVGNRRMDYHRYVFEQELGRRLLTTETVHHIDCDYVNDDRDNLYLYPNHSEHKKGHSSIDLLIPFLLNQQIICFDKGKYYIAELKRKENKCS